MGDVLHNGRRFRTFNVVDDFNRQALHIEIDTSITSIRLVRIFERLQTEPGLPQVLRTDNGPEFLGEAFTLWAKNAGMAIQYPDQVSRIRMPISNRSNRTYRDELLDQHLFLSLADVREATYSWLIEYNEERPHDALVDPTPMEARQKAAGNSSLELSPRRGSLRNDFAANAGSTRRCGRVHQRDCGSQHGLVQFAEARRSIELLIAQGLTSQYNEVKALLIEYPLGELTSWSGTENRS